MKQILGVITCVLLLGGQSQAKTANQPSAAPKNHVAVQSAQNSPERIKIRNQGVPLGNILAMQPEEVAGIKFYVMSGMVATTVAMKEDRLKEVVLNSKGDAIHAYYDVPQAQLANVFSDLASSKVLAYDTQSEYFNYRLLIEIEKKNGEIIQFATTHGFNNGIMLATLIRGGQRTNFEVDSRDMIKLLQYAGRSNMFMNF
ncbi:hypothetical protein ACF3NW_06575 [Eikenella halliae]|uniref:hypothetical protein n=1 Tax=Eikenella halliae TaxID=1795832 RepID=UPI0028D1B3BB|nr:hypothetical protein [Eikenella halliae]